MFPAALGGRIIIAIVGRDLDSIYVDELKRRLSASLFRGVCKLLGVFDELFTCFVMFMFALPVPWWGFWWLGGRI